jgi:hypothetical protein
MVRAVVPPDIEKKLRDMAHAGRMHRLPNLCGSRRQALPTKCEKNIVAGCWANDRTDHGGGKRPRLGRMYAGRGLN